jgi:predicted acyl esterase
MVRAPRDPRVRGSIDEASDAYDTVDWLVKHVPDNNGRAGIFGVSYAGWTAAMALLDPHPALRASSPQASPADMFLGDDFHHNGAFRLSYGFEYATMMETGKEVEQFKFDTYDTYDWYLKLGPLSNATAMLKGKIPTWNDFAQHANYDEFWQKQTIVRYLTKPLTVATLNVAGWWDQEDFYGPFAIYQALERQDRQNKNHLVVGPWNHGGWNRSEGRTLGKIEFGGPTSLHFRERIRRRSSAASCTAGATRRSPRPWCSSRARTSGAPTTRGRRSRGSSSDRCTSGRTGCWRGRRRQREPRRQARRRRARRGMRCGRTTSSCPIPPSRCPIGRARSRRPTIRTDRGGGRGRSRTSASCTTGPTC